MRIKKLRPDPVDWPQVRAFTQIISTGVLLAAFAFVAFIAYAIVSAVFQVSTSFKF